MIPIPEIKDLNILFGIIKYMPKRESLPDEFKQFPGRTKYHDFIAKWFFDGLTEDDLNRLKPKEGVDSKRALNAIGAILRSFEPAHEDKESACAYLLAEWFNLKKQDG